MRFKAGTGKLKPGSTHCLWRFSLVGHVGVDPLMKLGRNLLCHVLQEKAVPSTMGRVKLSDQHLRTCLPRILNRAIKPCFRKALKNYLANTAHCSVLKKPSLRNCN